MILFNYCTYSYSISSWTESDWDKYLDNLKKLYDMYPPKDGAVRPLVLPGIEKVWFDLLTEYGYDVTEAENFITGPSYLSWWCMQNLYGIGGPTTTYWIDRQAELGRFIYNKMKSFGWQPILPGWNGMVPIDFCEKVEGSKTYQIGTWNNLKCPAVMEPSCKRFTEFGKKYYEKLKEVFGFEHADYECISVDVLHERTAAPSGLDVSALWKGVYQCWKDFIPAGGAFIVQAWQWTDIQKKCMEVIPSEYLLIQDLRADVLSQYESLNLENYMNAFGVINNFGGRTGIYGTLEKIIENWNKYNYTETAFLPEGISVDFGSWNNIVLYTLTLLNSGVKVNSVDELVPYLYKIYKEFGVEFTSDDLETLKYPFVMSDSDIQGPIEAIVCANPRLDATKVSSWSSAVPQNTHKEALHFLCDNVSKPTTWYTDNKVHFTMVKEQLLNALNIVSYYLLKKIKSEFETNGIMKDWPKLTAAFYDLILDIEKLQSLTKETDFSELVSSLYNIIDNDYNVTSLTDEERAYEKRWLFRNNVKRLITIWYDENTAQSLANYAYREYAGLLSYFYLKRWKTYFETIEVHGINWANNNIDWTEIAKEFIDEETFDWKNKYTNADITTKMSVVYDLFNKYFSIIYNEDNTVRAIEIPVIGEVEGDAGVDTDTSDQSTVDEYKQCIRTIDVTLSDATTKEVYGTGAATLGNTVVKWYSPFIIENKVTEKRNVSLDFHITALDETRKGLNICCLFIYIKDKEGKIVASRHFGKRETNDNYELNNLTDNITFAMEPDCEYKVYFRVESSWSKNIADDGTLIDSTVAITRPSVYINIYNKETVNPESDDAWYIKDSISNMYYRSTGYKYSIVAMAEKCETDDDRKKAYKKLIWHLGRIISCNKASVFEHQSHFGRLHDGDASYLVEKLKTLFKQD